MQGLIRNVDLASRSIRLDILKPRIQENDFSEVKTKPDGTLNVHNTRYKSRIRGSSQVRLSRRHIRTYYTFFLDILEIPSKERGRGHCHDKGRSRSTFISHPRATSRKRRKLYSSDRSRRTNKRRAGSVSCLAFLSHRRTSHPIVRQHRLASEHPTN